MRKDAKAWIEEAIQVLDDNVGSPDALLRASGTAMGKLASALSVLDAPCPICGGKEPLLAVRAVAKRWPVIGMKRYFLALDLDLKGPDNIPVYVLVFADEPRGE